MESKSFIYNFSCDGFDFQYNTVKELAVLMCSKFDRVQNPYEPQTIEYEEFNEACYSLLSN